MEDLSVRAGMSSPHRARTTPAMYLSVPARSSDESRPFLLCVSGVPRHRLSLMAQLARRQTILPRKTRQTPERNTAVRAFLSFVVLRSGASIAHRGRCV